MHPTPHRLTVPHVDDCFGATAKACPDIDMLRLQPAVG